MSNTDRPKDPMPGEASDRMESVLAAFEDAWRRGERPNLADYLPTTEADRLPVLIELVHEDLEYRFKAGEFVRVEDYLRHYPDLAADSGAVVELIVAEWQLRRQRTNVTPEEYLQRFAPYREKLLAKFTAPSAEKSADEEASRQPKAARSCAPTLNTQRSIEAASLRSLQPSEGRQAWRMRTRKEPAKWFGRKSMRVVVLVLLGLGVAAAFAATYMAYRGANARRLDAERIERDNRREMKQQQEELNKIRAAADEAEATRRNESERRRRAEAEREVSQIALYARQVAEARRLEREGEGEGALAVLDRCRPDLRQWEWRYLRRLCRLDRVGAFSLDRYFVADDGEGRGASRSVLFCTFSPDGKSIVSAASDAEQTRSELRSWDLATGRPGRTYACPGLWCCGVCLSADGRVLAAQVRPQAGGPAVVRLWRTDSGKELTMVRREGHDIAALAFGPDGSWLVTGGKEGAIRVWESATGKERCHAEGKGGAEVDVAVSPDGKHIVSVGGGVRLLDAATCKLIEEIPLGDFQAVSAAFSSDGKWLAFSGSAQGRPCVRLRHPPRGPELLILQDFGGKVFFSPEGRYLAALGSRTPRLWDSRTGRTRTLDGLVLGGVHPDGRRALVRREDHFEIRSLQSPAEHRIVADAAVSAPNDTTQPVDSAAGKDAPRLIPLAETYGPPVLSGDGRRLAAAYQDGRVRLWDVESARQIQSVPAPPSLSLGLNQDGTRLATAGPKAGTLAIWDADTGKELCRAPYNGLVARLTFSPTGQLLAVSTAPQERAELSVWETATGKKRFAVFGASAIEFLNVVIVPDEKQILDFVAGPEAVVRAWDLLTGQAVTPRFSFTSGSAPVFSPDGRRIVCHGPTASQPRGELRMADAASGAILWTARAVENISSLAFSPDGRRLAASCAKGGRVRVWETETGQEVFFLDAHARYADVVRFTSDGQSLITLGLEGLTTRSYTVKRWDGPIPR
ncbi:MAG TPA: WD40 repeat domain-containing protein [Gemmataceae bacterium]|jgi:WD40 repeat protein